MTNIKLRLRRPRVGAARRTSRGKGSRAAPRIQVPEDLFDHVGVIDESNHSHLFLAHRTMQRGDMPSLAIRGWQRYFSRGRWDRSDVSFPDYGEAARKPPRRPKTTNAGLPHRPFQAILKLKQSSS